jgi:hypothetical protein
LVGCVVTFYVIKVQNTGDDVTGIKELSTNGQSITFRRSVNGQLVIVKADRARLGTGGTVRLENVRATLKKRDGEMFMNCDVCIFDKKRKKAYLSKNVIIKSTDFCCNTESVVVDFVSNSITGNSKLHGTKTGMRFTSSGFCIRPDGRITMNRMKIKGRVKR